MSAPGSQSSNLESTVAHKTSPPLVDKLASSMDLPATGSTAVDHLSRLSPELRLIIYDMVFVSILLPILDPHISIDPQTCYPTPPFLRVSGSIRGEALPVWAKQVSVALGSSRQLCLEHSTAQVTLFNEVMASGMVSPADVKSMQAKHHEVAVSVERTRELEVLELCAKALSAEKLPCEMDDRNGSA